MNLEELRQQIKDRLTKAGIEDSAREARWLIKHTLGVSDANLISGKKDVSPEDVRAAENVAARRTAGEPVSRIVGEKDFHGLSFRVTPDVLDPRQDTEVLVDAVVKRFAANPPRKILDLGTGSGCILIALLKKFPAAAGVGVDISEFALEVARDNAARNGVADRASFVRGDWTQSINESFDLIVSNPPYIPSGDIPNLDAEVRNHDPILALDGGFDGLDAYKKIFSQMKKLFLPGGAGFFEVGILQAEGVARLARNAGFLVRGYHTDSAGILRVVEIDSGEK